MACFSGMEFTVREREQAREGGERVREMGRWHLNGEEKTLRSYSLLCAECREMLEKVRNEEVKGESCDSADVSPLYV